MGHRRDRARHRQFPFPIVGIDSDNGSEFINAHLFDYCMADKLTFTRSRPGNKNDGAHVEQKNWTHVRELVGYLRFDTAAELELLNPIWELDRRFTNHLLTQQKLVRAGERAPRSSSATTGLRPRWSGRSPRGPLQGHGRLAVQGDRAMRAAALSRAIGELTEDLERLALTKAPSPLPRKVNRAFNATDRPEVRERNGLLVPGQFDVSQRITAPGQLT